MQTGLKLKLTGTDGNVFAIIGAAARVLRKNGMSDKVKEFQNEVTSGDYDNALQTCMKWFEVV